MITRTQERNLSARARAIFRKMDFPLTPEELDHIAVADFGLSRPEREGAQILTLFATERISAKLIVLLPGQILPEHYPCRSRRDLGPGDQVIIPPGRKHWMKGGPEGACVISFSTCVRDIPDQFTDQDIVRTTRIVEDRTWTDISCAYSAKRPA